MCLWSRGEGEGAGNGGEQEGKRRGKKPTSLQEMRLYSFKALGCIFTSTICPLLLPLFHSHSYIPSSPCNSPHSQTFHRVLSSFCISAERTRDETIKLQFTRKAKLLKGASAIVRASIDRKCFCVNLTLPDCRLLRSNHWSCCSQRAKKPVRISCNLPWDGKKNEQIH